MAGKVTKEKSSETEEQKLSDEQAYFEANNREDSAYWERNARDGKPSKDSPDKKTQDLLQN